MSITPEPSDHMRVVAVIQARMGSTRLPGKVLKPIAGKPLLWHIVHRLKRSQFIEKIAIATSTNPRDDAIVEFGRENSVAVVRGPEDDVLARFARAAELLDADIIVRVSADAPFVDAGFIDHLVAALIEQNGDYVLLEEGAVTGHEGVDPFSRRALDKLMMDASDDPVAREHVTGYFKLHPDFVRIARAPAYPELAHAVGRLTVDTPDDLAFAETLHERMAAKAGEASLADLLLLLEREPSLREKNAHVRQKALQASGGLALIRCDGGGRFGYGHVKRMVALARALRDREGMGAIFTVHGSEDALLPIQRAGFEATLVDGTNDLEALGGVIAMRAPDMLIADLREGLDRAALAELGKRVTLSAVIDDGSPRRLAADYAYYPPVPQAEKLDWTGSHCERQIGWQWAILGQGKPAASWQSTSQRPTLLVTMGGSDPQELTIKCAHALSKREPTFRARFVIGPGIGNPALLARAIVGLASNFETLEGADGLATEFASCDVALAAFGVTAYELAAYGVPAIYLCLDEDQSQSATAFEAAGIGQSLGLASAVSEEEIADSVLGLLSDPARRRDMRATGLSTVDGEGASRVAADLARHLAHRRAVAGRRARL